MSAFNYRQLVRKVSTSTWKVYLQKRKIELPDQNLWDKPSNKIRKVILEALESLPMEQVQDIYPELRRVHDMANLQGINAMLNRAFDNSALQDDFQRLPSDADRALWVMIYWPDLFAESEALYKVDVRNGKRGWKRFKVPCLDNLFRTPEDIDALERDFGCAFSKRKELPRTCEIEMLDRHLNGGVQLGILIGDFLQRQQEFDENNHTYWRTFRPPIDMNVVIYSDKGEIQILAPGGKKTQKIILELLGKHLFRKVLNPRSIQQPIFFLNRLKNAKALFDSSEDKINKHQVAWIRLSHVRVRSSTPTICDFNINPPGHSDAADVTTCLDSLQLTDGLMGPSFNIVDAIITLYFHPSQPGEKNRALHIKLKQSGISNLCDMEEADAGLAKDLLLAWGLMQLPGSGFKVHDDSHFA